MKIPCDIIGDIAILKFPFDMKAKEKEKIGKRFLKEHKNIKTILEKVERIKGRLRKAKMRFVVGDDKRETIHSENGCKFFLNVEETYFSSRLSNERKLIAEDIVKKVTKKKNKILVMFAGVAPFPIVIAKMLKKAGKKAEIISNEINKKANKFAEKNIELNKVEEYVKIVSGDASKLPEKLKNYKADFIVMPRPNLKKTFLDTALKLSKKGTRIYYYGFGNKEEVLNEIKNEIDKKIKIKIRKAGEIAPYKCRWLASFSV